MPLLLACDTIQDEQIEAVLKTLPRQSSHVLDVAHNAVLAYADAMTLDVSVKGEVFGELKRVGFTEKEIVEITATVAAYNCVSRFLVALDVGEKNSKTPL